ncbi:DNA-binding FadR family transcriptional regulator [Angulomicrobium tetraedrale]|uniref:DNA-binding FadR family transcriptional regulator n=1 Tax=Ancylobacter tetraedralis TaxID=217068 RepID=A0A839ZCP1_9HYPH|nr:FadR/GntR family transcriptional regulator [Ancylobacter tetraedralis]MBB3772561.1 DNA-binding FadR family transcriptional regulator [Ancylobacter tetraedralis]
MSRRRAEAADASGTAGEERPLRPTRPSGYRISGLQGHVITELGRAIVSGRFAPGELLPREPQLMAEFSASRPSLREALKVLAAKGLIEMRQKVGTRVRPRDLWNTFDSDVLAWHLGDEGAGPGQRDSMLRDLIELRQVIEPTAAQLAAGRATMEDLRRIRAAVQAMEAATGDMASYARADVAFHMAVFTASHNALFAQFAHLVADFLRLSFSIQQEALNERDNRIEDDVAQHRLVFEAINSGEGESAARAMRNVILNGKNSLLAALG